MNVLMRRWHENQVEQYRTLHPTYVLLAQTLEQILKEASKRYAPFAIVSARAKEISSFAEKITRKYNKYKNPLERMTDLAGARIVTYTVDQADAVCRWIESESGKSFHIDRENCVDKRAELSTSQFDYCAVHYVVELITDGVFGVSVPASICRQPAGRPLVAEIQVCTMLQHVWAAIAHDRMYKTDLQVPQELKRELARAMALLETADTCFTNGVRALDAYIGHFPGYLSRSEILDRIEQLNSIRMVDSKNDDMLLKLARLQMVAELWPDAQETFDRIEASALARENERKAWFRSDVKSDAAWTAWHTGREQMARTLLEESITLSPASTNAQCRLAETWITSDVNTAMRIMSHAFSLDADEPRVIVPYVECLVRTNRSLDHLKAMRGTFRAAIRTCENRIERKVYLPQACFERARLCLYLASETQVAAPLDDDQKQASYEALAAYAQAVLLSQSPSQILDEHNAIERIIAGLVNAQTELDDHEALCRNPEIAPYQWARMFVRVAAVARQMALIKEAQGEAQQHAAQAAELRSKAELPDANKRNLLELAQECDAKAAQAVKCADDLTQTLDERRALLHPFALANRNRATPGAGQAGPTWAQPIVIVAGGCHDDVEKEIAKHRRAFVTAFAGFSGTVISGGTTSGIAGLVGSLQTTPDAMHKIGYTPKDLPSGDCLDRNGYHTILHTFGAGHTPAGPIQLWADLLLNDALRPWDVRLIGINGGPLSAFEYRLAATLGAVAGLVRGSGRQADRTLQDPFWRQVRTVAELPHDADTWSAFVNLTRPDLWPLGDQELTRAAEKVHEQFMSTTISSAAKHHPSVLPWNKGLPEVYKRSNIHQAAFASFILDAVGYKVVLDPEDVKTRTCTIPVGYADKIEEMARMEHGRYCAERVADGWRLGPDNDPVKRTNPTLVPWDELSEAMRKYDREAVSGWPQLLFDAGLKIVPKDADA